LRPRPPSVQWLLYDVFAANLIHRQAAEKLEWKNVFSLSEKSHGYFTSFFVIFRYLDYLGDLLATFCPILAHVFGHAADKGYGGVGHESGAAE
jgi:hypothetical protein